MVKSLGKIPLDFFINNNVQQIAKDLLGKIIYTNINGNITSAIITETEAYQGPEDKASHAYDNSTSATIRPLLLPKNSSTSQSVDL